MGKAAEQGAAVEAETDAAERARVALLDAVARMAGQAGKEAVSVKELEQLARTYAIVVGPGSGAASPAEIAGGTDPAMAETLPIVPVARHRGDGREPS
ncbi:hypothetical protein [Embleya hyalina]|uniref:Uncharacterized protein n=1 Tax=Embleya hyalina TaxID=516124 RepID=A0A401YJN1_9ACTN|nr:hypothetical protein [Embleya hyalina]GCD94778.1 hypothetical protein EHYA_02447 [Embleya hyalina]